MVIIQDSSVLHQHIMLGEVVLALDLSFKLFGAGSVGYTTLMGTPFHLDQPNYSNTYIKTQTYSGGQ
ncbi:hypothetical protein FBD94_14570 [Pedobacter hiemivivus]|uniref:Uncharacterized protein n=1 Tax=Pedobacter hiemivivus TaxID=2530454 RepID=A0A4U1G8C7_9SPHI|nr:hypothetical protein [Pedobacter hiemivivus]TKC60137.1 hypothetical protein FBD94_14570 [Pedobacter hiemivivus]